jgi:hypothetical protein
MAQAPFLRAGRAPWLLASRAESLTNLTRKLEARLRTSTALARDVVRIAEWPPSDTKNQV